MYMYMNNKTADTPLFISKMEGEVINSFLPDLVTAVSDSVLSVSDQCLAKGLINETVYKRVLESGRTSEDKARTLILAVKKSTKTDSRCLEILLNILDQELPFAIRENLLSKIRKELTEKASTCREVVPLSKAVQQVPLGELSKETTIQQSFLLGRFEDSIRQHAYACAEKKLLEERLKVKSEKCERLKGELETLKGQNQELASNTQSIIVACTKQIENLEKRIEKLQKTIEEQNMQARRGKNTIITKTGKMFVQLARQSQEEIQRREEEHKAALREAEALATKKAEEEMKMKEREHRVIVQEKELRIRELEVESKQKKKTLDALEFSDDMLTKEQSHTLFTSIKHGDPKMFCRSNWRAIGSQLGFSTRELDDIKKTRDSLVSYVIKSNSEPDLILGETADICTIIMLDEWLQWHPGDSRGSTSFPTYSTLQKSLFYAGCGNIALTMYGHMNI